MGVVGVLLTYKTSVWLPLKILIFRKVISTLVQNGKSSPKSAESDGSTYCIFKQELGWIFGYMKTSICIWKALLGFDEYMNIVLDDAEEVYVKTQTRKQIGRVLLKGDNITLIQNAVVPQ